VGLEAPNGQPGAAGLAAAQGHDGVPGSDGAPGVPGTTGDSNLSSQGGTISSQPRVIGITSPPPSSVPPGATFGLTATVEDSSGQVDTSFNGDITLELVNPPSGAALSGPVTVRAVSGVAVFSGLSLNLAHNGYQLEVTSGGLSLASVSLNVVGSTSPPTPPTIIGELPLFSRKPNKHHKPVGKPVLTGFEIEFSTTMNPATAGNASNYQVAWISTKRVKKKPMQVLHPVPISVQYNAASDSVNLLLAGTQAFKDGGQITVVAAAPGGVSSALGVLLDGNNQGTPGDNGVFAILPKARGITRA
jgi:hypothetical protein